jgi:hypothetical protein
VRLWRIRKRAPEHGGELRRQPLLRNLAIVHGAGGSARRARRLHSEGGGGGLLRQRPAAGTVLWALLLGDRSGGRPGPGRARQVRARASGPGRFGRESPCPRGHDCPARPRAAGSLARHPPPRV